MWKQDPINSNQLGSPEPNIQTCSPFQTHPSPQQWEFWKISLSPHSHALTSSESSGAFHQVHIPTLAPSSLSPKKVFKPPQLTIPETLADFTKSTFPHSLTFPSWNNFSKFCQVHNPQAWILKQMLPMLWFKSTWISWNILLYYHWLATRELASQWFIQTFWAMFYLVWHVSHLEWDLIVIWFISRTKKWHCDGIIKSNLCHVMLPKERKEWDQIEEGTIFSVKDLSQHLGVDHISCLGILLVVWKESFDIITAHCPQECNVQTVACERRTDMQRLILTHLTDWPCAFFYHYWESDADGELVLF